VDRGSSIQHQKSNIEPSISLTSDSKLRAATDTAASTISAAILLRREIGDDFFETRLAAERVPERMQFQLTIAERARALRGDL
jgi:hypothetical protein